MELLRRMKYFLHHQHKLLQMCVTHSADRMCILSTMPVCLLLNCIPRSEIVGSMPADRCAPAHVQVYSQMQAQPVERLRVFIYELPHELVQVCLAFNRKILSACLPACLQRMHLGATPRQQSHIREVIREVPCTHIESNNVIY